MDKFRAIAANAGPMDEQLRQLMEARTAWKEFGNEVTIATGKVVKFFASGPEVADYARHRGDKRMNIAETVTSMKNWSYVNAFKDSVSERVTAQFEAARANRPAGWFDESTGKLYLATKSFGRAVGGNYDKALDRARNPGEYQGAREAVGMRQTYGADFFDQTMASTYTGDEQRVLSDNEFNSKLMDKDTRDTLQKLKALDGVQAALQRTSDKIRESVEEKIDLAEEAAQLDVYAQSGNMAANAMWNFADALVAGHGGVGSLMKELGKGAMGIGKDAALKALYMLGEGWAFPSKRVEAFAAAKFYGLTAALAIPTSAALGALAGSSGGGGGASSHSSSAGGGLGASITSGERDQGGVTIIVDGNLYGDPQAFGRAVADGLDAAQRSGRTRLRSNRYH